MQSADYSQWTIANFAGLFMLLGAVLVGGVTGALCRLRRDLDFVEAWLAAIGLMIVAAIVTAAVMGLLLAYSLSFLLSYVLLILLLSVGSSFLAVSIATAIAARQHE